MVQSLKSLKYIEDKNLIAGHICKFLGNFDRAQVCNHHIMTILQPIKTFTKFNFFYRNYTWNLINQWKL